MALVGVTALALFGGGSVDASLDANTFRTFHYVAVLALIGAGVVAAWGVGLRAAAAGTTLLLAAGVARYAPTGYTPVMSLNAGLTVLAVLAGHLSAVEFAVRNPTAAKDALASRAARLGAVVGAVHVAIVFWLHSWLGFSTAYVYTLGNAAFFAWFAVGAFLVGTAVGALWVRYRLVTPALVVACLLAWSVADTMPYVDELRGGSGALAGTLFTVYELGWVAVLAAALVAGGVEYALRSRLRLRR